MDWTDWGIWNVISAVASVLALVAIIVIFVDILHRRRRMPAVWWSFDSFGNGSDDHGPLDFLELTNNGVEGVRIVLFGLVNAELVGSREFRMRWQLQPADRVDLALRATDIGKAWSVIIWQSADDRRYFHAQWLPCVTTLDFSKAIDDQMRAWRPSRWWRFWSAEPTGPVGPEAAPSARYRHRAGAEVATFVAALSGTMQYVKDRGGVIYSAGKVVDTFDEVQKPLS